MKKLKMYARYFWYVLRHKWYVARECFRAGLYWQGLTHDLSKFLPSEFFPYAENFYGDNKDSQAVKDAFMLAWMHHQKRNPHHWEYWMMVKGSGVSYIFEMEPKYRVEMICDWIGAGLAITGKRDIQEWYKKNAAKMLLAPKTRFFADKVLLGNSEN